MENQRISFKNEKPAVTPRPRPIHRCQQKPNLSGDLIPVSLIFCGILLSYTILYSRERFLPTLAPCAEEEVREGAVDMLHNLRVFQVPSNHRLPGTVQ